MSELSDRDDTEIQTAVRNLQFLCEDKGLTVNYNKHNKGDYAIEILPNNRN